MNSIVSFEVAPSKMSKLAVCFAVGRPAHGSAPVELEPQAAIKSVAPTKTTDNRTHATHIRTLTLRIAAAVVTGDAKCAHHPNSRWFHRFPFSLRLFHKQIRLSPTPQPPVPISEGLGGELWLSVPKCRRPEPKLADALTPATRAQRRH